MSALYGFLRGDRGTSTRASHRHISAEVQTWQDRITVNLSADGDYSVVLSAGPSGSRPRVTLVAGNVADAS